MPSRRQVLASSGVAVTGGLGSCLSKLGLAKTGHLQGKAVSLEWEYDGGTYVDEPLALQFDPDERSLSGRYDPSFVGESVRAPDDVVVNEAIHSELSTRFDVRYLIGVCGEDFDGGEERYGCRNTWTNRSDFSRVQLNDRTEVRLTNHRFDVVDVYEDAYAVESADVRTFDFTELHEDDGIPPGVLTR